MKALLLTLALFISLTTNAQFLKVVSHESGSMTVKNGKVELDHSTNTREKHTIIIDELNIYIYDKKDEEIFHLGIELIDHSERTHVYETDNGKVIVYLSLYDDPKTKESGLIIINTVSTDPKDFLGYYFSINNLDYIE